MMSGLGCILIADSSGVPFYSRNYNEFSLADDGLLSGLISAIGSVGKRLFNQRNSDHCFWDGIGCGISCCGNSGINFRRKND